MAAKISNNDLNLYAKKKLFYLDVLRLLTKSAVIFHKGPFDEMGSTYHALGVWMAANKYEMNGPTRAIYHKGP
ncbi:hypothetical protein AC231_18975 [Clostridium pasteurianum]|uniref:hypothetical protein n=1 Tax=Clostridium pasteurianum TaxID=1501 RepID=UPI0002A75112|nr:hypothetical protein [Clostridium pasteurianum]AOZ74540.1 hypothetical protein AQ983_05250 [Clostridium pasteurianum DSM 525 = ATCC 6013]AOZ78337.1 hypothetical protein AQ984_05240 [Clostridium pasteurianum]ELP59430.1 transcriptional activator ligand binding domain-containing protein [Clostridium pasteurianum DSM 525 = ATCC 6013]OMH19620.1 hypothetical protein AC231_18975 [Clostridium pasteurianum]UZW15347.1 hypothetical protein OSC52_05780 [Clostridium pasteurianum]